MDEDALIRRFFADRAGGGAGVIAGIGDDAAVLGSPPGEVLLVATDCLVEGTHFTAAMPPESVGHRALAVNLSDLAAMGARPAYATLALSVPAVDETWLEGFARGLLDLAAASGVALVGGDTVRGPLAATVTVLGYAPPGAWLPRGGARPGDVVCVTGWPGEAGLGWRELLAGRLAADHPLARPFLFPAPRVAVGLGLRGVASAAIDLSDGLAIDLARLLAASRAGAALDVAAVPCSPRVAARVGAAAALELALAGGDDYELCFTVPPDALDRLHGLAAAWALPVHRLGEVRAAPGLEWQRDGHRFDPTPGFTHFGAAS